MFSLAPVASGFVSTLNHKRRQACPFGFLVNQPKADASLSEEAAPVWLVNAQVTIQFHGSGYCTWSKHLGLSAGSRPLF